MRRHHLIEEAKAELDVAYEEVKRAENRIMELEQEYNARIKTLDAEPVAMAVAGGGGGAVVGDGVAALMAEKEELQAALAIDDLYQLQGQAIERFAAVSSAFTVVGSVEDEAMSVDLLRRLLFRRDEVRARKLDIDRAVRDFTRGLRAYMREASSIENDGRVRDAWARIEGLLRGFGRNL